MLLGWAGGGVAGTTGCVCDGLFVTLMREMKEVRKGRNNQRPGENRRDSSWTTALRSTQSKKKKRSPNSNIQQWKPGVVTDIYSDSYSHNEVEKGVKPHHMMQGAVLLCKSKNRLWQNLPHLLLLRGNPKLIEDDCTAYRKVDRAENTAAFWKHRIYSLRLCYLHKSKMRRRRRATPQAFFMRLLIRELAAGKRRNVDLQGFW